MVINLLAVCLGDTSPSGARDAALIGILRGAGLRRAEVTHLELRNFDPGTGKLEVYRGKGSKDRRGEEVKRRAVQKLGF
ncbi:MULTISPECIES: hypothetical protein [unclassified Moorena]|uniref:hypothetical protein n=1 Tax=unclassified Moorena TaxID=2683338 RepID=UPI0013CA4CC2|nr:MULTISPECIES: hypothetical protein [unclassified Moorena]NEO23607.1 hypothetical protein [Moorena sp. SIO4A5]NEQ57735.1 hypothetical protein [Moorena sp. SIO4A1]